MLVGLLGGDELGPIYVIRLWAHCQNRRQDTFENLTAEALKALCRFSGPANKLESSLAASGFIRRDGEDLKVLNWAEYNSALIAAWQNGAKGGRPKAPKPNNNQGVTSQKPRGKPTGSREEKRREEKIGEDETEKKIARSSEAIATRQVQQVGEFGPGFESFWSAYGKKTSIGYARNAWANAILTVDESVIIKAAIAQTSLYVECGRQVGDMKSPDRWLEGECWTDDLQALRSTLTRDSKPKGATHAGIPAGAGQRFRGG